VVGTLIGVAFNFVHIDPIKALFITAVINGVAAVPLMVVMMVMTRQSRVMGQFTLPRWLQIVGWISTAAMALAVATMFATTGG
jgi:Mn2+/Fe2+ NRAMP family transporter